MLLKEDLINKNTDGLFEFCKKDNKKIVIMPSGAHAQMIAEDCLSKMGIEGDYFVDNDKNKQGKIICGKRVLSFNEMLNIKNESKVIIATNPDIYKVLINQLSPHNIDTFYASGYYTCYTREEIVNSADIIKNNYDRYLNLYHILEDELSKNTLDNILKYRCNLDETKYLDEIRRDIKFQYFEDDIYKITNDDVIVDCGAYTGDTLSSAMSKINGSFKKYYAFEPDKINFEVLKKNSPDWVNVYNFGCHSEIKDMYMIATGNEGSKVANSKDEIKNTSICCVPIDEYCEHGEVTFLKMDIEGAEMDALKGAKRIIQNDAPTLAISVYHKFNDIFDIPELIESYRDDYKYYLRHYTDSISETVFYAVKK